MQQGQLILIQAARRLLLVRVVRQGPMLLQDRVVVYPVQRVRMLQRVLQVVRAVQQGQLIPIQAARRLLLVRAARQGPMLLQDRVVVYPVQRALIRLMQANQVVRPVL